MKTKTAKEINRRLMIQPKEPPGSSTAKRGARSDGGGRRHTSLLLACCLSCFVVAAVSGCESTGGKSKADESAAAPTVAVVEVARKDLASQLEIASEFLPYQEINVYAKVSGYIQKLYVDWGTHVKQGQILAVLEIPELQQQLDQDEAAVHRSENDLEGAREALSRSESEYKVAHLTSTRLTDVQKSQPGLVAQEDIDVTQGKDVQANAGVSASKDFLAAAEQALLGAKAALEKDKAMYAYARITAPFDGIVTQIDAYTGALLPAGTSSNKGDQSLCHLSQNDLLRLVIPLPERALGDVHLGETVAVHVNTNDKTFDGKIVSFSGQVDTETRTMHTEVHVPNPNYELVPGMYASVQIPLHNVTQVLVVPIQTVQASSQDRGTVLVVNGDKKIEKREVTLGLQTPTEVEITSGLRENEMVVFGEQNQYQAGELVTPKITAASGME